MCAALPDALGAVRSAARRKRREPGFHGNHPLPGRRIQRMLPRGDKRPADLETPWYGSRQMGRHMQREGHKCGRRRAESAPFARRVRRLMKLMRLVPIHCPAVHVYMHERVPRAQDQQEASRAQDISISVQRLACHPTKPGLVHRHHPYPPSRQICLANRLPGKGCGAGSARHCPRTNGGQRLAWWPSWTGTVARS